MGKIYSPPKEIGKVPEWDFDRPYTEALKKEEEWTKKLVEWCKKNSSSEYAGEIIQTQVADGYAQFMVLRLKPVELIWLPLGDAWDFRWAHRWTASDIKNLIEARRNMEKCWGRR